MGNPVVHFEIGCRDRKTTREFYAALFEWKIQSTGMADMINTAAEPAMDRHNLPDRIQGVCGHISALGHEPHQYVTVYVQVEDIAQHLAKAEALGGKTIVPPTEVPEAGSFAWLSDPEGNVIGLWKPIQQP